MVEQLVQPEVPAQCCAIPAAHTIDISIEKLEENDDLF